MRTHSFSMRWLAQGLTAVALLTAVLVSGPAKAQVIADSIADQYTSQVGMFLGMAGLGSYFLDLFAITRNEKYLQQGHGFARKIMLYQVPVEKGIAFPGENLIRLTNDYGTGSAGIGLFLHRLQENGNGHPLFFELETTAVPSLEMA